MRLASGWLALAACHGTATSDPSVPADADTDTDTDTDADADADTDADTDPPPVDDPTDWCLRLAPGPGDGRPAVLGLSDAHATVRLYGFDPSFIEADLALADALAGPDPVDGPDLDAYAAGVTAACALDADDAEVGPASVELRGDAAWIHPGTGPVDVPAEATAVVLDLRGLPGGVSEDTVLAAASAAIGTPVDRRATTVRDWYGYVDTVFSPVNVYTVSLAAIDRAPIPALGVDRPLFVVNDAVMAPAAARLAWDLADQGRATLVGHDVPSAVAGSTWTGVGSRGIAARTAWFDGPDVVKPDLRTDDPDAALADLDPAAWPAPTPAKGKKADPLPLRSPFDEAPPADLDEPVLRSDLVSVHGAVRQFWRYGAAIGDPTGAAFDDRLLELLSAPLDSTTNGATRALGRLGEALHDGHVFFAATTAPPPAGYLPVTFDHLADRRPVVRWSMIEGLAPGDTITAIDGLSIEAVYEDLLTWNGAATDGYALDLASRQLAELDAPTTYGVVDPDGVAREVTIDPQPYDLYVQTPWEPSLRPSGRLADLGAPDIAFLNLASEVTFDTADALAVIDDAAGATGLVVDMRGYPAISHYEVAAALIDGAFGSPQFLVNDRTGPDLLTVDVEQYPLLGTGAYTGPIVLLVGPGTASAAENFSMMLVGADRVTVVGRRSAGTNGNITGLWMPGGLYFTFTGMEVLFPDGGPFHGIGITPDVEVAPTAADLRDGRDVELEAAIALLR